MMFFPARLAVAILTGLTVTLSAVACGASDDATPTISEVRDTSALPEAPNSGAGHTGNDNDRPDQGPNDGDCGIGVGCDNDRTP